MHKFTNFTRILAIFMTMSTSLFAAKPLNVFVLTGQSNSLGIIKDGEPLELKEDPADKKIKFYWVDRDPRANIVSTSKGKIDKLQVQMYDNGAKNGHWGLEINCFRQLYKKGLKNIMVIKVSRGGGGNSYWFKDAKDHHMYDAVLSAVKDACKLLDDKKVKYNLRGLLYLQGESDGGDSKIADVRAETLLENLRKELPNAGKMKMFIGGIAGGNGNQDLTRQKHKELAEKRDDVFFIDTYDLLKTHLYRDRLHFNNEAKHEIGKRFADTIEKAMRKKK